MTERIDIENVRPVLARGAVRKFDRIRHRQVLLTPEKAQFLDDVAARILTLCDGRTIGEICERLAAEYAAPAGVIGEDVPAFLAPLIAQRALVDRDDKDARRAGEVEGETGHEHSDPPQGDIEAEVPFPIGLLAELTHSCPLKCVYCSNPLALTPRQNELSTAEWARVFTEAADLGVLQLHLSGGEPALRKDLPELVARACDAGLYTNLITSGLGITETRMGALVEAGLHHVQLSFQGADETTTERVSGVKGALARKRRVAGWARQHGLPLTLNVPVHRHNLDQLEHFLELAVALDAERIEIAHVQYYGWALRNRESLMPSLAQVRRSLETVKAARERYAGRLVIDFVTPDYYAQYPKACMGGWGRSFVTVGPEGTVMPCHAAHTIPGLKFETVRDSALAAIWWHAPSFTAFRGTGWMPEPCRSCPRKEIDWGGCRCQALAIAGDAAATDPVCRLSPHNAKVQALLEDAASGDERALVYRANPAGAASRPATTG